MPVAGIIGAVGSVVGGILGHNAAQDAAAAQAKAAGSAAAGQTQAGATAQSDLQAQIANEAKVSSPYTTLGANTGSTLNALLAPGGQLTQGWNQTFQAPTAAEAAATPGYQFQLQQGLNALQNSAAARGGLLSTGTAKNLNNYAQGVASTNYQNTFNNALQAYGTNFNTFNTNQNNLFNRLYGTTALGANSANSLNALQAQGTGQLANNLVGNAQVVGNDIMGVGNAQAAGIIGSTNALTAGLGGAANSVAQGLTLQQVLGAQNASNSGGTPGILPGMSAGYTPPEAIYSAPGSPS